MYNGQQCVTTLLKLNVWHEVQRTLEAWIYLKYRRHTTPACGEWHRSVQVRAIHRTFGGCENYSLAYTPYAFIHPQRAGCRKQPTKAAKTRQCLCGVSVVGARCLRLANVGEQRLG